MTYSEAKALLDEIAGKNTAAKGSLRTSKQVATNTKAQLDAMPAQYSAVIDEIQVDAAANPTDKLLEMAGAEAAHLAADFVALKATAADMVTALAGFDV